MCLKVRRAVVSGDCSKQARSSGKMPTQGHSPTPRGAVRALETENLASSPKPWEARFSAPWSLVVAGPAATLNLTHSWLWLEVRELPQGTEEWRWVLNMRASDSHQIWDFSPRTPCAVS